jgi:hypothetical protein
MQGIYVTHFPVQVLDLIEKQMAKVDQGVNALLLVGGFAGCAYLFQKVQVSKLSYLFDVLVD